MQIYWPAVLQLEGYVCLHLTVRTVSCVCLRHEHSWSEMKQTRPVIPTQTLSGDEELMSRSRICGRSNRAFTTVSESLERWRSVSNLNPPSNPRADRRSRSPWALWLLINLIRISACPFAVNSCRYRPTANYIQRQTSESVRRQKNLPEQSALCLTGWRISLIVFYIQAFITVCFTLFTVNPAPRWTRKCVKERERVRWLKRRLKKWGKGKRKDGKNKRWIYISSSLTETSENNMFIFHKDFIKDSF